MHKKTHNTQPSKPPAMAGTGDTFEMDAGDTTPGGMAVGVLQEKESAGVIGRATTMATAALRHRKLSALTIG